MSSIDETSPTENELERSLTHSPRRIIMEGELSPRAIEPTVSPSPHREPRKLVKKRRPKQREDVHFPQHLREDGDDADEDVTAPKGAVGPQFISLNQSMRSWIKATGPKNDMHSRLDDASSGSESEPEDGEGHGKHGDLGKAEKKEGKKDDKKHLESEEHPPKRKQSALRRSLPKLNVSSRRERNYMSHSVILPPRKDPHSIDVTITSPRNAPVLTRMITAQAEAESANPPPSETETEEDSQSPQQSDLERSTLEIRLQEIFEFEAAEDVLAEYPVWLLQSVCLQGYMYITSGHVAFYAYLPKRSTVVAKSGYLSKRGKQNPKFNRYWFTLKGDVLSYYLNPSDLYFPSGNIDLRYAISAGVVDSSKDKSKECHFTVSTNQRTYVFKADSPVSAREWVKTLQKVIFRSHNDGDSVKISLPIANIIDIEESPVIDFAETVKIRVIDSDETYAIDEYFFSFFSFGKDAISVLRSLIDTSMSLPARAFFSQPTEEPLSPSALGKSPKLGKSPGHGKSPSLGKGATLSTSPAFGRSPILGRSPTLTPVRDHVRATLSPARTPSISNSPRASMDHTRKSLDLRPIFDDEPDRRKSIDQPATKGMHRRRLFGSRGRSTSTGPDSRKTRTADQSPAPPEPSSSDSYVQSMEPSATNDSSNASASQILSRSDVFQTPTLNLGETGEESGQSHKRPESGMVELPVPKHLDLDGGPSRSQSTPDLVEKTSPEEEPGPSLQKLVKGSFPLKKAAGFADYLRKGPRKLSSLLASESMGYVEKVSGMWQGGRRHYVDGPYIDTVEPDEDILEDENVAGHGNRFRGHFALPESEKLQATFFGYLHRVLPLYGKIYIGSKHFCFRSLLPGTKTRLILPLSHIENVTKERGFSGIRSAGLAIVIQAYEELFFEFSQTAARDDCAITLLQALQSVETTRYLEESGIVPVKDVEEAQSAQKEHKLLQEARRHGRSEQEVKASDSTANEPTTEESATVLFDDPRASILNFKPTESLRITCLTIGSRGDVQPYIALCKGLLAEGHKPKIATHVEFEPWIRKHGIDFAPVDGDPAELMRICVEYGMFTYSFLKEASLKFRGWIDELLSSAWKACQESDILIESPSAMAGIHIAEALGIPYFRAFTMPWTRTRAYPHAFAVPERKMGGAYNYVSYVMFDNVFWTAIAGQVNRWRRKELGLRSTNLDKLHPNKVPFLYNFSPSVVVPPLDYSDWIRVTGYWFLDEASDWEPSEELTNFIAKAREDGKKLVYIGFGSIVVSNPTALTKTVVESVLKADVRCILSKGWSDRLGSKDANVAEVALPPEILQIKSAPHDWLFKQIDAAAHHGGAGTTGASLRAGIPTIIKPFFGDQFFFGSRVEDLGVGICMKKLNVSVFSRAIWEATHSQRMVVKAKVLGEHIRSEHGVNNAIEAIYRDLEYAKSLIKNKTNKNEQGIDLGGDEETWTFIGDESDPELIRLIANWKPPAHTPQSHSRNHSRSASTHDLTAAGKADHGHSAAKQSKSISQLSGKT